MMKRILISLVFCAIAAVLFVYANVNAGSKGKSDVDDLKAQVAALEKRVAVLEEKVKKQPSAPTVMVPQTFPKMDQLPKGWQKRNFNGMTYYLVPVQETPNK